MMALIMLMLSIVDCFDVIVVNDDGVDVDDDENNVVDDDKTNTIQLSR